MQAVVEFVVAAVVALATALAVSLATLVETDRDGSAEPAVVRKISAQAPAGEPLEQPQPC